MPSFLSLAVWLSSQGLAQLPVTCSMVNCTSDRKLGEGVGTRLAIQQFEDTCTNSNVFDKMILVST